MGNQKTIVIASGGTGGHLYPTIAVADEIKRQRPDLQILFIGTKNRIEAQEVPRAGYEFIPIAIESMKKDIGSMLKFSYQFSGSVYDCSRLFSKRRPSVMLGGGAYLSVPVGLAAWMYHVPIALLEINSVAGSANKILSYAAEKIFLAYPESANDFSERARKLTVVSGTPVRADLGSAHLSKEEALKHFGLPTDRPTILAFGGSLGARAINGALAQSVATLAEQGFNVIWQTGKGNNVEELQKQFQHLSSVKIQEYLYEMEKAYAAADLVISRAGASTLAELARLGKPAILVPYPFAAQNHQEENARSFERSGAAVVLRDLELQEKLLPTVLELMKDYLRRTTMAENMHKRENKDAAKIVAEWLILRTTTEPY